MPTALVNGVRLTYSTHGRGEPILLIPPAASRATLWRHQVPAFIEAGYQVFVYNLRETLPSGEPPRTFDLADLVTDAAELITTLGIGPSRVLGASLGALIAQELTLAKPSLVMAVALIGTRGRIDAFRAALARGYAQAMRTNAEDASVFDSVAAMSHLFAPRTLADNQFTANWLATYSLFHPCGDGAAAQYEAAISYDRLPRLRDIRRPSLVISFSHDMIMPPSEGAAVAAAIPCCQHVELPHCGHFGFLERPDEVNRVLLHFFANLDLEPYSACARASGDRAM